MLIHQPSCCGHVEHSRTLQTTVCQTRAKITHNRRKLYFMWTEHCKTYIIKTPWPESASELYRPSNRHLSAKLAPTFADRGYHVVSVTDLYGSILGFLDRAANFSFK
jgi:hypothetical protein